MKPTIRISNNDNSICATGEAAHSLFEAMTGCYNNDAKLFSNQAIRCLAVSNGHIFNFFTFEYLARCLNDEQAESILTEAGYVKGTEGQWSPASN
jgi:hypothetical protein